MFRPVYNERKDYSNPINRILYLNNNQWVQFLFEGRIPEQKCYKMEIMSWIKSEEQARDYIKKNNIQIISLDYETFHQYNSMIRLIRREFPEIKVAVSAYYWNGHVGSGAYFYGKKFLDDIKNNDSQIGDSKRIYEKLVSLKAEGYFQEVDEIIEEKKISESESFVIANFYFSRNSPKLYVITAPSGFGKSTLIDELRYFGLRQIPKITTRHYRSISEAKNNEIIHLGNREFNNLESLGELVAKRVKEGNAYGILRSDLEGIYNQKRHFLHDTADVKSALKLRDEYPDLVRLVTIFPSIAFAGEGLERRLELLTDPHEDFDSFAEELEYLRKTGFVKKDTENRLKNIEEESREFNQYLPEFDIVLRSQNPEYNLLRFLKEISR